MATIKKYRRIEGGVTWALAMLATSQPMLIDGYRNLILYLNTTTRSHFTYSLTSLSQLVVINKPDQLQRYVKIHQVRLPNT